MPIILGTVSKSLPYSKAFLGSNLVYQKISYTDVEFTTCPFPTSWAAITTGTNYTATNEYGLWEITAPYASSVGNKNFSVNNMFDGKGNASDGWQQPNSSSTETFEILIESPVKIKPSSIYIQRYRLRTTSTFQGFNEDTQAWETLATLTVSNANTTTASDYDISTDNFYRKFRISGRSSATGYGCTIYEFQITSGTIRMEA